MILELKITEVYLLQDSITARMKEVNKLLMHFDEPGDKTLIDLYRRELLGLRALEDRIRNARI